MNQWFQSLLGLKQPSLPADLSSQNFTHDELEQLLALWGGGNVLSDPNSLVDLAEKAFTFENDEQYFADKGIKMMWQDGLGPFLIGLWTMIAKKKGYPLPDKIQ